MKKILLFLSFLLMSIGMFGSDESVIFSSQGYSNGQVVGSYEGTDFNITFNKGTNSYSPTYYTSGTALRCYGGNYFVVSSTTKTISKIDITFGSSDGSNTITTDSITYANGTWNGEGSSIKFMIGGSSGNRRITQIDVTFKSTALTTYTVIYDANGGSGTMTDSNSPYRSGAMVTVLANTFTRSGYTFNKWNTASNGSGADYDADDTFTITSNTTLYAQWIENTPTPPTPTPDGRLIFELLTTVNDLHDGDSIVILDTYNTYAMSTHQKTNNRDTTSAFNVVDDIVEVLDSTKVQIIRVDSVLDDNNNWKFFVGNGYLYAADKNNNYLRTQIINDDNGKWDIKINQNTYEATIIAQGLNTHNLLQYNATSKPPVFSCYRSQPEYHQTELKIYKKVSCATNYTVIFKNNGIDYDTILVQSCLKRLTHLPSPPSNNIRCNNTAIFVGWSQYDISNINSKPTDLFQTVKRSPTIDSDKTFYAVFANIEVGSARDEEFELTIETIDFSGFKYEDNNNEKTNIAVSTNPLHDDTVHVKWTSYNVMRKKNGMQWKAKEGYIYNSTVLGCISDLTLHDSDGTFTKYFGTSEKSTASESIGTNNGYFYILYTGDKAGKTSKISVIFTKNIVPKSYSNYTTYCIDTLQFNGDWNKPSNWKHNRVPEFNEAAVLLKSATVNIPHAFAKYVIIDKSSSNTGKLTIGANQGLEIQDTISVYDGTYKATTPNDLVLESSSAGNASLIFNNNNNSQATVYLYSKAIYSENGTANWQYIGTNMTELSALYNYYGSWVYKWVGEPNKWEVVHNGDMMQAWVGYCITQRAATTHETSGQLVPTDTEDKTITIKLPHTVFANSWTAPIHIGEFATEDFNVTDKTIYFFNTGLDSLGNGQVNYGDRTAPGTYVSVPINAATFLDKDSLIPSQQGVFVKTTTNGSITLRYKDLVRPKDGKAIIDGPLRSPKRTMSSNKPNVLKIYAHGSIFGDRLTILEREDFSTGFDNGWDGDKMSLSDIAPSIYVVNEDGSFDEVSAIPDYEGTVLGFKNGSDSICRLTFKYDGDDAWYLNDLVTLTSTLISDDNEYIFTCGDTDGVRFIISATPYSGVSTGIGHNSDNSKPQKYFYNGNLYIIKNNRIFDTVGNLVK